MNRIQKIEELIETLRPIRRQMMLGSGRPDAPRITPAQWGVLRLVAEKDDCTVKDIAQALRISSSAATQLMGALVKSGHLVRKESASDRRAVALSLSPQTKARITTMKNAALQKTIVLFDALDDRELEQYVALSKKVSDRVVQKQS